MENGKGEFQKVSDAEFEVIQSVASAIARSSETAISVLLQGASDHRKTILTAVALKTAYDYVTQKVAKQRREG